MTTATKTPKADPALVAAVDVAAAALAEEVAASEIGAHLGARAEADRVVTHRFEATSPAYTGWHWAVTIARGPRQKVVTINEVVLLPGESSLRAPDWLPWKDRVSGGDLGPGDLIPVAEDDIRLVAGYLVGDEALDSQTSREVREVVRELGLGRERILSIEGRDDAADRWISGLNGPDTPIAQAAPGRCASCGFMVRLGGSLATVFGLCANGSSPSDGQAVSLDHGCGAHSDIRPEQSQHQPTTANPVHDTLTWDTWGDTEIELIPR